MLRKHTKKLRLGIDTLRVLTQRQTARVHGGKLVRSELCTSEETQLNCDPTGDCPLPTG